MFLQLNHQRLYTYSTAKKLIFECYGITKNFPHEESYNLVRQIRRAAVSVLLNIAEGSSKKSQTERIRFFEIARGSVIELDAAFEISQELGYFKLTDTGKLEQEMKNTFIMISKLMGQRNTDKV